jgi:hypothetical protein
MQANNTPQYTSRVEAKVLRNNNAQRTVTFENVYYILLRNLGQNDAIVETGDQQEIFLPAGGQSVAIRVDEDKPIWDTWKGIFNFGPTEVHVLYTYANPVRKLL